jgi:hypothetical protein
MVNWGFVVIMSMGSTEGRRTVVIAALAVVIAVAVISACGDSELGWTTTKGSGGTPAVSSRRTGIDVHAAEFDAQICDRDIECD